jgi:hypothetical protein
MVVYPIVSSYKFPHNSSTSTSTTENNSTFIIIIKIINWANKVRISYASQAVAGSIVNPRETPQRPGRRATAVALGLYIVMNPIMQWQVDLIFSIESDATLYMLFTPSQHGVPSAGSGSPNSTKFEHPDIRDSTVVQSTVAVASFMLYITSTKNVAVQWGVLKVIAIFDCDFLAKLVMRNTFLFVTRRV